MTGKLVNIKGYREQPTGKTPDKVIQCKIKCNDGKVTSTKTSEVKIPWTCQQSSFKVPSGGRITWIAATYYNTETKKPINSKMTKDIGEEILFKLVIEKCTG